MDKKVNNFVQSYLGRVIMDDPARLTAEDLKYGEGWSLTDDEREQVVAILKERGSEFKRMAPGEEVGLVARVLQELSEWCIQLARKEKTSYHAPVSVDLGSVRLGSALGRACSHALWMSSHMHVHQAAELRVDFLVRFAEHVGLGAGTLHTLTAYDYEKKLNSWSKADQAEIVAAAEFMNGRSDVPPAIVRGMVEWPTIWKTYVRDWSFFRKSSRSKTVTVENLRPGWTPELVLAGRDIWETCRLFTHRGSMYEYDIPRYQVYRTFLERRGVWAEFEQYLITKEELKIPPMDRSATTKEG